MTLRYGDEFATGRAELVLLGVGVALYLAASTVSQALLALDRGCGPLSPGRCRRRSSSALYAAVPGGELARVGIAFAAATLLCALTLTAALLVQGGWVFVARQMRTPVSVGVVCGASGLGARLARAFDALPQATLRWICDADAPRVANEVTGRPPAGRATLRSCSRTRTSTVAFASGDLAGRAAGAGAHGGEHVFVDGPLRPLRARPRSPLRPRHGGRRV